MSSTVIRLIAKALLIGGLLTSLSACDPGSFPIPKDRSAPPKPAKKGVTGTAPYHHGGPGPLIIQDTVD